MGPPCIFGPGRGPGNTRSIQVYDMVRFALREGFAPVIGTGRTEWDHVHVHDLSDLIVSLADEAAADGKEPSPELFGERGYLFCEAGAHSWGDVAKCELRFPRLPPPPLPFLLLGLTAEVGCCMCEVRPWQILA